MGRILVVPFDGWFLDLHTGVWLPFANSLALEAQPDVDVGLSSTIRNFSSIRSLACCCNVLNLSLFPPQRSLNGALRRVRDVGWFVYNTQLVLHCIGQHDIIDSGVKHATML